MSLTTAAPGTQHADAAERVRRACAAATSTRELLEAVGDITRAELGADGSFVCTTDPVTALPNAEAVVVGLPDGMRYPWMRNEFIDDDLNKFGDLHARRVPAATLHRAIAEDMELGFDPLDCDMGAAWDGPRPKALATEQNAWRSTGDTVERLEALVGSTDGFELAEVDLELRGQGQLLGTRQTGLSDLRFTRPRSDQKLLKQAREAAGAADRAGLALDRVPRGRRHWGGRLERHSGRGRDRRAAGGLQ